MRLDYHHPNFPAMKEMRRAGFRMILYGLESANQTTLDRLNKGINIDSAVEYIKRSAKAGLEPHIAVMFGYPWETYKDELRTLKLVKWLLVKGYAKTAQASTYCVPGTTAIERGLKHRIYEVGYNPEFWFNRIISIRNMADINYLWRSIRKVIK